MYSLLSESLAFDPYHTVLAYPPTAYPTLWCPEVPIALYSVYNRYPDLHASRLYRMISVLHLARSHGASDVHSPRQSEFPQVDGPSGSENSVVEGKPCQPLDFLLE
jgi:hypothetical protein